MGAVVVVMVFVLPKRGHGVALVEDQDAVEEFATNVPTKRSAIAFALGACTGVLMTRMSVAVKTASNAAVNLASRSRMRNRNRHGVVEVHEQVAGLLGHQAPVGCAVTPRMWTRREACSMTKKT